MNRPPRPFPVFQSPQQASRWAMERFWDGTLPVNPVHLCRKMGIACVVHEFSDPNVIVESGFVAGKPTIRLSKACLDAGGTRPRFATAHAMGHVLLHWDDLPHLDRPAPSSSPV